MTLAFKIADIGKMFLWQTRKAKWSRFMLMTHKHDQVFSPGKTAANPGSITASRLSRASCRLFDSGIAR